MKYIEYVVTIIVYFQAILHALSFFRRAQTCLFDRLNAVSHERGLNFGIACYLTGGFLNVHTRCVSVSLSTTMSWLIVLNNFSHLCMFIYCSYMSVTLNSPALRGYTVFTHRNIHNLVKSPSIDTLYCTTYIIIQLTSNQQ